MAGGKRKRRAATEGTFLETVKSRLDMLEFLLADLHWSTLGQFRGISDPLFVQDGVGAPRAHVDVLSFSTSAPNFVPRGPPQRPTVHQEPTAPKIAEPHAYAQVPHVELVGGGEHITDGQLQERRSCNEQKLDEECIDITWHEQNANEHKPDENTLDEQTFDGEPNDKMNDSSQIEQKSDEDMEIVVPEDIDVSVVPTISEVELVYLLMPRVTERCDAYLAEIDTLFCQGGCSREEILQAGLAEKMVRTLPGVLLEQLSSPAHGRLLGRVRTYITGAVMQM